MRCFLKQKLLKVLAKKVNDPDVIKFMESLNEKPRIDEGSPDFPGDDSSDYYFLKSGIMLMFNKVKGDILKYVSFYFLPEGKFEKFNGFYNLIMNDRSTKKSILKLLGAPTRENNTIGDSYGKVVPRWMCYDYEKYTLRCSFYGDEDKLAKVSLMIPENASGRVL